MVTKAETPPWNLKNKRRRRMGTALAENWGIKSVLAGKGRVERSPAYVKK